MKIFLISFACLILFSFFVIRIGYIAIPYGGWVILFLVMLSIAGVIGSFFSLDSRIRELSDKIELLEKRQEEDQE